jgi:hypothetical protein
MLYGPGYKEIWTDQPPTPSDVSEWLRKQRIGWSVRTLPQAMPINEVTKWAREQGLKRLDWDFIPKQFIWFRDPQVAMIWDLTCSQKTTEKTVDSKPK